jgi:methyl-accepting chemotaxis protein
MLLHKLTISTKIIVLSLLAVICLTVFAVTSLQHLKAQLLEDREEKVKSLIEAIHSTILFYEVQARSGALTEQQAQDAAKSLIRSSKYDGSEYFFAWDLSGTAMAHGGNAALEGKNLIGFTDGAGNHVIADIVNIAKNQGQGYTHYIWPRAGQTEAVPKIGYIKLFEPWGWAIGTGVYIDDIERTYWQQATIDVGLAVGLLLVTGAIAFWIGRDLTRSLGSLSAKMDRLAHDDIHIEITEASRSDEVGLMAKALSVFKSYALERRATAEREEQFKAEAEIERRTAVAALADAIEQRVSDLTHAIAEVGSELCEAAASMVVSASETKRHSNEVLQATEQSAATVQSIANATNELSAASNEIARQITYSSGVVNEASREVGAAQQVVSSLVQAATHIGAVVKLIDEIAGRTNLLALNATIEAARAGDAGKGFSVVASEVKALAGQTGKATGEISSQVAAIQKETTDAVAAIAVVARRIDAVGNTSTSVATAIEEQHAAIREIARNISQTSQSMGEIGMHHSELAVGARHTSEAAEQVAGAAGMLAERGQRLEAELSRFLAELRQRAA